MRAIVVTLLLIGGLAGCATVQKDWENAKRINTAESYKKFLSEHSNNEFSRIAEINIEKLEWGKANQAHTVEAYRTFLSSHPTSEYSQAAKTSIEKLEWVNARQSHSVEAYRTFLSSYPASKYNQNANANIEELEWQKANKANTIEAYLNFILKHPESRFKQIAEADINKIITKLEKEFKSCKSIKCSDNAFIQWENAVWQSTNNSGGRDEYSRYLLLFPSGKNVSLAQKRVDEIDWLSCQEQKNIMPCQKYLLTHKKGDYRKEAQQVIINIEYESVKQKNTIEAYDEFLKKQRDHEGALARRRQLLYSKAVESGGLDDWLAFRNKSEISSYKRKKWEQSSRSEYDQMMSNAENEIERLLYEKAISKPSLENYRVYLKEFPKGLHKQQIIVLMEPLFIKEARSLNTVGSYNNYLEQYPTGYSSDSARTLLDPVLWAETKKKNSRDSYEYYIKKFPNGSYSDDAEKKILWMKSNPAKPKIAFPKQIIGSGYRPRFSWVTKFSEESGRAGYYVSGRGWVIAKNGGKYGPNGRKGSRDKVTVKAGGTSQDDHWVRGDIFCGGRLEYDWEGKDTNGHRVYLKERINLICK